jgi:hypothetical protein
MVSAPVSTNEIRHGGSSCEPRLFDAVFFDVDENIGAVQNVVRKIFLDDVTFIAEANDEVVQPVMGVIPHNVPKDGVGADLDHWLWSYLSFFGQTRAHSPGKYHHFHGLWSQNEFFTAASKHCMLQIGKVNCGAW